MGLPPTGEIIARPMVQRACGHTCEFQHYAVDKYRAQRLAKFKGSRCAECVAVLEEEQRKAAPVPKGEAYKSLPVGAQVALTLHDGGVWAGSMSAEGSSVEAAGPPGAGPQAVILALARQWLAARGVTSP